MTFDVQEKKSGLFFLKISVFKKDDRLALSHYFQCSEGESWLCFITFDVQMKKSGLFLINFNVQKTIS